MAGEKKVKARVLQHVHLAGREHSKDAPCVFEPGQVVELDKATAEANPHFFAVVKD